MIFVRRLIVSLAVTLPLVLAASAHAYVYWGDPSAGTIGRANLDGSDVTDAFIHTGGRPVAVAVNSSYIYWADEASGTIGRANIDGSAVEPDFITGIDEPRGVTVSPTAIFWVSLGGGEIGRANLNGSGQNLELVTGITAPCSIAIDSGHIYWGGLENIGRASLSGSSPDPDWVPLKTTFIPCAIAVNSANVFIGNNGFLGGGGHEIGRVGINGTGLDESIIGEAEDPCGMTISGTKLYWANEADATIGVANTDATDADEELVHTGGSRICGVAVDSLSSPLTPPSNPPGSGSSSGGSVPSSGSGSSGTPPAQSPSTLGTIRLVKLKPEPKLGSARLSVAVDEAGTLSLTGKGIVTAKAQARGAETVVLTVRAAKAEQSSLKRTGRLTARVVVSFSPSDGGTAATLGKGLTLREQAARRK